MAQVYCHLFGEGSYQDFTPSSSFPDARLKIRWLMFSILTFSIGIFIVLVMIEVMLMKTLVKDCDKKMMFDGDGNLLVSGTGDHPPA